MKKLMAASIMLLLCLLFLVDSPEAQAKTTTYHIKSTVDVLNIREKPSTKSKILGKLKKNQTIIFLDETYNYKEELFFYKVLYKGKQAYVASEYSKLVQPSNKWLGKKYGYLYSSAGVIWEHVIYKKTGNQLYFLSRLTLRGGQSDGVHWDYTDYNYFGKAKITSKNTAIFNSNGCKATFKLKNNSMILSQQSKKNSCTFTHLNLNVKEAIEYKNY